MAIDFEVFEGKSLSDLFKDIYENTEKFNFKISWLREIIKLSSNLIACNKNLLIAGDFNVLEETSDVKNFENWEKDALGHYAVRKIFREILSTGLINIVRLFNRPGSKFSFWDYQKACWERNYGLLIDHFLVSPLILQSTNNIFFDKTFRELEKPSDHIPVIINIER